MPVAPRIVNDVSYVSRINHESHFSWHAQSLEILQCHFFVAGAAFGDLCNFTFRGRRSIWRCRSVTFRGRPASRG